VPVTVKWACHTGLVQLLKLTYHLRWLTSTVPQRTARRQETDSASCNSVLWNLGNRDRLPPGPTLPQTSLVCATLMEW
jgi:hypothetical protein